jgi:hypothetical protein
MAINKNHLFEDLDGVKCAVVESGVTEARRDFLKPLLELNGYTVVVVAEAAKAATPAVEGAEPVPAPPATYKIGVTDVTFNATNAIFGRLLRTRTGKVVTLAYWQQREDEAQDEVPYFSRS